MKADTENFPDFVEAGRANRWSDNEQKLRRQVLAQNFTIVGLSIAIVVLVTAVFYFAVLQQPKHYVLKVDERNRVSFGGYLDQNTQISDDFVPTELVKYVEYWRTVTPDNTLQKRNITRLYCMMPGDAASTVALNGYFQEPKNDPFVKNEQQAVLTELRTVLQLGELTWSVEWDETTRTHDGNIQGEPVRYKANMLLGKGEVTGACREANPLGLYVKQLSWAAVL